jgi:uncharacterized membrane protein
MTQNENIVIKPIPGLYHRITALDLARFLAMVMMIQGHAISALTSTSQIDITQFPWDIWNFIRGLTAPVFLTVSGAVHVFANKRDSEGKLKSSTIKRRIQIAISLIIIGYALQFPAKDIYDLFYVSKDNWAFFFRANILQIFGFSLLFLLLTFILTKNDKSLKIVSIIIGTLITILTPFVFHINWFSVLPIAIAPYFSVKTGSLFTFFPYTAYIFFGTALGVVLKNLEPDKRTNFLYKNGIRIGLVLLVIGYPLFFYFEAHHGPDYLRISNIGMIIIRLGYVFSFLTFTSYLHRKTMKLTKYYNIFGRRALFIYVTHLIILYGTPAFNSLAKSYENSISLGYVILITIFIEIACLSIVYFYEYSSQKYPGSIRIYSAIIVGYILFVLFLNT